MTRTKQIWMALWMTAACLGAQTRVDLKNQGKGGVVAVKADGGTVGSRMSVNLVSGGGVTYQGSDDGTNINLSGGLDTSLVATRDGLQSGKDNYCVSGSGSSTDYTCALPKTLGAYADGMLLLWKPDQSCNGGQPLTLNVDANGAARIFQIDGISNPVLSQCGAGLQVLMTYGAGLNGGAGGWRILSSGLGGTGTVQTQVNRLLGYLFDGGGSTLVSGKTVYIPDVPFSCTMTGWSLAVDGGTATVDILVTPDGTQVPTSANSITGGAPPTLTTGTRTRSTHLSGWTAAVSAHSVIGFYLSSVAGATQVSIGLECDQ